MKDNLCLIECVNGAFNVLCFTKHKGLKVKLFELQRGQQPRTELTYVTRDRKSFLSNWRELFVLVEHRPKIPIYVYETTWERYQNTSFWLRKIAEEKTITDNFSGKNNKKKSGEGTDNRRHNTLEKATMPQRK